MNIRKILMDILKSLDVCKLKKYHKSFMNFGSYIIVDCQNNYDE